MNYIDLGLRDYQEVLTIQKELFEENLIAKQNNLPTKDTLLFCEHPHVITIGKSGKEYNLLFNEDYLKEKGVSLFRTDRGGDVTYHGQGQLVAYPIFDLEHFVIGLREYIDRLEEVMIRFLSLYDIKAERNPQATGVWLDVNKKNERKIGAIGVRSSRYITMHGFALNINTDLSFFQLINPCGFTDKGVTSLEKETGNKIDMENVKAEILSIFKEIF